MTDAAEHNKRIYDLAKAEDIAGLREFFQDEVYQGEVPFGDDFMTDDTFARLCCQKIIEMMGDS